MKKLFGAILMLATLITGCSKTKEANLVGKAYVLVQENPETEISIQFDEEKFFGNSGVNRYFGTYSKDKNNLTLNRTGSTLMAAPDHLMKLEKEFLASLDEVKSFEIKDSMLILNLNDGTTLKFSEGTSEEN